jgi:gustatory receptor
MRSRLDGSAAAGVIRYQSSTNRKMQNTESIANIYTSVKPLLQVSMLFGLTPFSIIKTNKFGYEVPLYRLLQLAVFVILTVGLFTAMCYSIHAAIFLASSIPEKIKITFILNTISQTSSNFVLLITRMCFNKRHIIRIFKKIRNVDGIIEGRRRIEIYRKTKLRVLREISILFIGLLLSYSAIYYVHHDGGILFLITVLLQNLSYAMNIVIILEYVTLVRMLMHRYKYINDRILEYSEIEDTGEIMPHVRQNHFVSVNVSFNRNYILPTLTRSCKKRETCGVHTLRLAYINLYDTVTLINSHFGVPVLLQIFTLMMVCVTSYYYGLYIFNNLNANIGEASTFLKPCLLIISTSFYGILFVWMIVCCHGAMQEGKRGLICVQRVTACPTTKYNIVSELQNLSHQLKHMKVEFTACGIFVLNLPLLATIIGGIFTYILIMIQLD